MGILYIIATPIGNLEDITLRALRILKEVDVIAAEDTRHTNLLLRRFALQKPLLSLHQHSSASRLNQAISLLKEGKHIGYVVDAGTPGVSDPASDLVEAAVSQDITVVPIPGPSALAALISVAGIPMDKFTFLGFLPKKKGRKSILQKIATSEYPVAFFESSHRIIKTLQELSEVGNLYVIVGRELTKQFETIYRGTIQEVLPEIQKHPKGEFTVIIKSI